MRRSAPQAMAFAEAIKLRQAQRDVRYANVAAVRRGDYDQVASGLFPDDVPMEVVANVVDAFARDMSETMAPLPSFNCTSSNMVSDRARKRADTRTKIAAYYIDHSKVQSQNYSSCDNFVTFGHSVAYIEPDFDTNCPRITLESPVGGYPEFNKFGEVTSYTRYYLKTVGELCSMYPDLADALRGDASKGPEYTRTDGAMVELVRYCDRYQTILFLPQQGGLTPTTLVKAYKHPWDECPVKIAVRPQWDAEMRGQWDSVIWVQVARARMAQLAWEAAEKAVSAPLAVPNDVTELNFGADAVIYSQTPEKVRRVPLEIPQSAFAENALLGNEMRLGARQPEGRSGNISASVVTGRGVQELSEGWTTQIATGHNVMVEWWKDVVGLCFKMDETLWPNEVKTIRGTQNDAPYEVTYRPGKDIDGDHTIDVVYGMAAGMDNNRAVVMLLQLRGDNAISRDFLLRQMPFNINVTDEQARIEVEQMRDALMAGLQGYGASIAQMAANGMDPSDAVRKMAEIVAARQKGAALESAIEKAFAPVPPPAPAGAAGLPGSEPQAPGAPPAAPPGAPATGAMPGAGGAPPGGGAPPDLATALATLTSGGQANMRVGTTRNRAI